MVSSSAPLDEDLVSAILQSGHSRVPVWCACACCYFQHCVLHLHGSSSSGSWRANWLVFLLAKLSSLASEPLNVCKFKPHRGSDRCDIHGLILVKEALKFMHRPAGAPLPRIDGLALRRLPRLPADTPLFDVLRFFQVRLCVGCLFEGKGCSAVA